MKRSLTNRNRIRLFSALFALVTASMILACQIQYPAHITIFEGENLTLTSPTAYSMSAPAAMGGMLTEDGTLETDVFQKSANNECHMTVKLFGLVPVRTVTVHIEPKTELIACGNTVGIKIFSKGLVCVGTQEIVATDGSRQNLGRTADIRPGDILLSANDVTLTDTEELSHLIANSNGSTIHFTISRSGQQIEKKLTPLQTKDGYKLGIWLRDSTAGIGTLTFYNPDTKAFGALGHPIADRDTGTTIPVLEGSLLPAGVIGITKGAKGEPGELKGIFKTGQKPLGVISKNTDQGVFGTLHHEMNVTHFYPVASSAQIKEGPATILSNINGDMVEEFDIEIQKASPFYTGEQKDMILHVTDPKLLEKTGGIVQGMSGSPVLQNGKIVGAVTHVFVNDPTRGYGIFIENMLKEVG
ncbi:MAG: SpoIVB peptidase [Clostridia bacterium]|nr:SpoIVB peptidase [Clostridia bacterium]